MIFLIRPLQSPRVSATGKHAVQLTTIDHVAADYRSGCTFIKMDVEGNELLALKGGENIILRDKPSLIVSCYH